MAEFSLDIVTPEAMVFAGDTSRIIVRTAQGDIAVLKNHESYISPLGIGTLKFKTGENFRIGAVAEGFMQVMEDKVTVLADTFEWADEIDVERANKAKERAEKRLQEKSADIDLLRAEIALKKAIARLDVSKMLK